MGVGCQVMPEDAGSDPHPRTLDACSRCARSAARLPAAASASSCAYELPASALGVKKSCIRAASSALSEGCGSTR